MTQADIEVEAEPPQPTQAVVVRDTLVGVNIEALLAKAIDAKSAVEVLERLMAMRREAKQEAAKEAFDSAMAAFQAECPIIHKNAEVQERDSAKVRYRYAPLDAIVAQVKPLLEKHGLSHKEDARVEPEWVTALCKVTHKAGHSETSEFRVPIDPKAYMNAAQKFASALTFAKRYAFCAAFGILTGDADDDANSTGQPQQRYARKPENAPGRKAPTHDTPSPAPKGSTPIEPPASGHGANTPPMATAKHLARLVEILAPQRELAERYFKALDWLMPTETLEKLPLRYVPISKDQLAALAARLDGCANGEPAARPYEPNPEPLAPKKEQASVPKPIEVPRDANCDPNSPDAPWRSYPVPWGKHAGVALAQLDKGVLFGFWANFKVETEYNGKPKKPETIAKDRKFREMLDEAGKHYEFAVPEK